MCSIQHKGVVLNMRGVALRCMGDLRGAAESYQAAVDICQEYEDMPNWAVALANQGNICFLTVNSPGGLQCREMTLCLFILMQGCYV